MLFCSKRARGRVCLLDGTHMAGRRKRVNQAARFALARIAVLALVFSFIATASAQQCTTVKVEMATAEATKAATANMVVRIPAPGAVVLASSETHNMAAAGIIAGTKAKIALYTLGGDGSATAGAVIDLPLAPELDKYSARPVGVVFHPKLPLLYVWQELVVSPADLADAKKPFIKEKFFHGLIYQIGAGGPKLLESFGNGWSFDFSPGAFNGLSLSPSGMRLFPPSAYVGNDGPNSVSAMAYYELGADGLTAKGDDKTTPILMRQPWGDPLTNGWGFVPASDNVVVIANRSGFCTWDIDNRLARYTIFYLNIGGATLRIGGEPAGPSVYGASIGSGNAFSMQQVEGYITLVPKMISLPLPLTSRPVAMTKRKLAAIPAKDHVYLATVDDNGEFTGKVMDLPAVGFMGYAAAYSAKSDRLYLCVETAQ